MADKQELVAISLVSECKALHERCLKAGNEAIDYAIQSGAILEKMKANVPHGSWEGFVSQYLPFSTRTAQGYIKLHKDLGSLPKAQRAALLDSETSLRSISSAVFKPKKDPSTQPTKPTPAAAPSVRAVRALTEAAIEVTPAQAEGLAQYDTQSQIDLAKNVASGAQTLDTAIETGEIVDLGECPVCGGKKWDDDGNGLACAKCCHPHGEPAGDPDERRKKELKTVAVKTIEAAQRAYDDLQGVWPSDGYEAGVEGLKVALRDAKARK